MSERKWWKIGTAGTALALLLGTSLLTGCGTKPQADQAGESKADAAAAAAEEAARDSGFVTLESEARTAAGITIATAGPGTIEEQLQFPAEIRFDPAKVLDVKPRFPGVVRELRKNVGDSVRRGEVVAEIESNESLSRYPVSSSLAGRVITRDGAAGQAVGTDVTLFTIADLSTVWIDFSIYPNQVARLHRGDAALVTPQSADSVPQAGVVSFVGPSPERGSGVSIGRVVLPNPQGRWQPGLFAEVKVTVDRVQAPLTVPDESVVRTDTGPVVFVVTGGRFRQTAVEIGRTDGKTTQIRGGLAAGVPVVVHGAYTLRSELEKSKYEE